MTAECNRDVQIRGPTPLSSASFLHSIPNHLVTFAWEKSLCEQRRLFSNPGWLFVWFGGGHGKLHGTHESEGIKSAAVSPGWGSPSV